MRRLMFAMLFFLAPIAAFAQAPAADGFDFMLGEWRLDVHVKVSGLAALIHGTPKLSGTLKARRTPEGIEDELAVVDASGNPRSTTRTRRVFDAANASWNVANLDDYHAGDEARARREGDEMHVTGSYGDGGGKTLTRSRYYAISADAFRFTQDRSHDGGTTWDEGAFAYDATRIAASPH